METCDPGYALCDDLHPCSPHLCDSNGESTSCGKQNIISPDGTYTIQNQKQNWFCAATASGEYPVDRSQFNVRMGYNPGDDLEPYCCIQPKPPGLICHNKGTNNPDGSCNCSTAVETLTDCSHSGGIGNNTYNSYNGSGSGSDGRPGGINFNVQFTGEACEIPAKLPDNFVKWFNHNVNNDPALGKNCQVNRDCLGDTTQCVENNYICQDDFCSNNGTICGNNNNTGLDHQCTM